jgi:hypothetical protein
MIGSPGGIDFVQNTEKSQAGQVLDIHLEIVTVVSFNDPIGYYF